MRTVVTLLFIVIACFHLFLGVGAGYAALRLWYLRHRPFTKQLGPYLLAFVCEVLAGIVLLFVARGVRLTWKYAAVWFAGMFVSDLLRAPLILFLIKGRKDLPPEDPQASGALPPDFWRREFREAVREELGPIKTRLEQVERKIGI